MRWLSVTVVIGFAFWSTATFAADPDMFQYTFTITNNPNGRPACKRTGAGPLPNAQRVDIKISGAANVKFALKFGDTIVTPESTDPDQTAHITLTEKAQKNSGYIRSEF